MAAVGDRMGDNLLSPHGKMCVTQGSTVDFLRPAAGEYLLCRATPVKVGKNICVVSVEQRNDAGALVTTALFTFAVVKEIDPIIVPPKHDGLRF